LHGRLGGCEGYGRKGAAGSPPRHRMILFVAT
jgi:hypothetical protein